MNPEQPPLIGKAPKIKVILVKDEITELENVLKDRWKVAASYPHAKGALFLLLKD